MQPILVLRVIASGVALTLAFAGPQARQLDPPTTSDPRQQAIGDAVDEVVARVSVPTTQSGVDIRTPHMDPACVELEPRTMPPGTREYPVSCARYSTAEWPFIHVHAASDGRDALVTWTDDRLADPFTTFVAAHRQGSEVKPPAGLPLGSRTQNPSVAWGGDSYLVAWSGRELVVQRFKRNGQPLDAEPITLEERTDLEPRIASGQDAWLVVWAQSQGAAIVGKRVSKDGHVLDEEEVRISREAKVTWDGTSYIVTWHHEGLDAGVRAVRVSPEGGVRDIVPIRLAAPSSVQELFAEPVEGGSLIGWHGDDGWKARYLSSDGTAGETIGLPGSVLGHTSDGRKVSVVYRCRETAKSTCDPTDVRIADITSIGAVDDRGVVRGFPPDSQPAALMGTANGFYLVFTRNNIYQHPYQLHGVWLDESLATISRAPIVRSADAQFEPDIAFTGTRGLVAWRGDGVIQAGLLDDQGGPLGAPFVVGRLEKSNYPVSRPAVAWNGEVFLVAWNDRTWKDGAYDALARAARVTPDGVVLDETPIELPVRGFADREINGLDVSAEAENFVVAWTTRDPRDRLATRTTAVRLTSAGSVLDPSGIELFEGRGNVGDVAVASSRTRALVAWQHSRGEKTVLRGAILEGGTVSKRLEIASGRVGLWGAASDGLVFMLTWTESRSVRAAVITDTVTERVKIDAEGYGVAIGWTGSNFLIAWEASILKGDRYFQHIHAVRVTSAGQLVDRAPIVVANARETEDQPAVSAFGDRAAVTYRRDARLDPDVGSERTYLRLLEP